MDRRNIESTMIRSIGYDVSSSTLEIEFNDGPIWQYYDVPESLWFEFDACDSHGKFFHSRIKNQYSGNRVG